jgi:hypothetical protein
MKFNFTRILLLVSSILFFSCVIEPADPALLNQTNSNPANPTVLPVLTTTTATTVNSTSATSGGTITSDGGSIIIARGVVWSTSQNPTIADSKTVDGNGIGSFTSSITNLAAGNTYYVRAYATNANGTAYGNQVTISTISNPNLPVLTTIPVTNNVAPNAKSGGNITSDGGSPVIDRGVVWGFSPAPTYSNSYSRTHDGTGIGSFVSNITTGLPGTLLYVRAYATNANGIAYGNEISFTIAVGPNLNLALMTANINGNQYDFMTPYLWGMHGRDVSVENSGAPAGSTVYLWLQGTSTDDLTNMTTRRQIDLHIPNDKWTPGTYSLVEAFDTSSTSQKQCQATLLYPSSSAIITSGTLTVTEFNLTQKRIKGTFSFNYTLNGSSTVYQVTNGTFIYALDHAYFN